MSISKRQLEERKMRQDRILTGALEVFKTKGLEGATMDEIAAESGLVKQHYIIISIQKKKCLLPF